MRPRRGATDLAGVLPIDKPAGITSHDAVAAVRSATGEGRVGHSGTLDPLASGLLLVLVGRATRLEQYLVGHDKCYDVRIRFGATTDTLDSDGAVTEIRPVPPEVMDPAFAREVLASFVGTHQQHPPAYSAIKSAGVAAHRRARAGEMPELEPRTVTITVAGLVGMDAADSSWDLSFAVSKGTYVRALARDIGRAAGTVAHVTALRRTHVGPVSVQDALSLDEACTAARSSTLSSHFIDPVPLLGLPVLELPEGGPSDGSPVASPLGDRPNGEAFALVTAAGLLGVYRAGGGVMRAKTAFVPELSR